MLATIRDKASGWVAGIIVGALIISFALWGVGSYFGNADVNAARVNGTDIKLQAYQRAFYNLRQQMQQIFGDALSIEEDELIKQQTIQKLVSTELVNQIIEENNLRISDQKVVETIKNLELFKDEEGFDRFKYERGINSLGMDPVYFERQLRMDLLSEQLQAGLSESLFVPEAELDDILRIKSQQRDITYSILSLDSFVDEADLDESEITAFYESNKGNYIEPEKVKVSYVELDVNALAKNVETGEENLRAYYENNKDKYDVLEQRSVTKLFIKTAEETADKEMKPESDEVIAKAKETIERALAMVKDGMSFEEIIEKFTEEGKGALEFSEHAFMSKGIMEKEVDEFLFASDEGEISDIIETKKGLNIVKVGEIRGGPKNVYEKSAEQVQKDYKISEAELQFFDLADKLTTLSYEHSDTLDVAAEAIGHEIKQSDYFSRDNKVEGVLSNPKVVAVSFNPEAISSGENSDAIEVGQNHIVILRVEDHKTSATKPLEAVRDDVIADIKKDKASQRLKDTADAIVEQLQAGKTTDNLEIDTEIEWFNSEKVARDAVSVNRAVLRTAFQSGKPEANKPVVASQKLGSGDYAVVMVTAVYDESDTDVAANDNATTDKDTTELELLRARGSVEWQDFLKNARTNADVTVYEENL